MAYDPNFGNPDGFDLASMYGGGSADYSPDMGGADASQFGNDSPWKTKQGIYNQGLATSNLGVLRDVYHMDQGTGPGMYNFVDHPELGQVDAGGAANSVSNQITERNRDSSYDRWVDGILKYGPMLMVGGAYAGVGAGAGAGAGVGSAGASGATNAALIDSYLGTAGYGASSAGLGGGAGTLAGAAADAGGGGGSEYAGLGGEGGGEAGGYVSSSADKSALYGNTGYGSTTPNQSLLSTMGNGAAKGAAWNAGSTAVQGGSGKDILKSGLYGAVGGAVGAGIGAYNPAGEMGITDPQYQNITNRAISSGTNAALAGGNGQQIATSALTSGATQGVNELGNSYLNNSGSTSMPDSSYDNTSVNNYLNNMQGQSRPGNGTYTSDLNFSSSPQPEGQSMGTDFNPSFQPQQSSNPFKSYVQAQLAPQQNNGGGQGTQYGDMAGSLLGLYSAYEQRKRMGQLAGNLGSMFGSNSPYAQQLGQALSRRDAAAGRRSQYGPREVELQAKLAEMNSRNAPQLANLYNARDNGTNAMYNNLLKFGQQSGATNAIGNYASPWFNSMFNQTPANSGPQMEF